MLVAKSSDLGEVKGGGQCWDILEKSHPIRQETNIQAFCPQSRAESQQLNKPLGMAHPSTGTSVEAAEVATFVQNERF